MQEVFVRDQKQEDEAIGKSGAGTAVRTMQMEWTGSRSTVQSLRP